MTRTPILATVLPNDSSCANLARAHHNLMLMSLFVLSRAYMVGANRAAFRWNLSAMIHSEMRDMFHEMATLNDPPEQEIVIVIL